MIEVTKYLIKPYNDLSYNCWTLVRDFYTQEYGLDLFGYSISGSDSVRKQYKMFLQEQKNWLRIDHFKEGAILTFSDKPPIVHHVGVYLGDNKFIHNTKFNSVIISDLSNSKWKHNLEGIYEYKQNV